MEVLLESPSFRAILEESGRTRVVEAVRAAQERMRGWLSEGAGAGAASEVANTEWYAATVRERLERTGRRSLRGVINATGVVLHTNLGRAPLAEAARQAMIEAADYASLEYNLAAGRRGSRHDHCVALLRELSGAADALVVNNNAAAVVLALNTLGDGRAALISRGELVEIGGSFRVPEIMERSGVRMREVGATNRTHLRDYQEALSDDVGLILKVHRSNFRVEGFTAEVAAHELAGLARGADVPLVHDLGSGALMDLTLLGLPPETTAGEALASGADVVTLSGDKLLGGPQAGILLGRGDLLERMRRNPLARALRCDKLTLAALEATLALYRDDRARAEIPVLRMLGASADGLRARAEVLARRLAATGLETEPVSAPAAVGGGACPGVELPGTAVALAFTGGAEELARRLRLGSPPVIGRIRDGRLLLDPRTVPPEREDELVAAVGAAVEAWGGTGA